MLARHHLRVEDVYCYHLLALESFAAVSLFEPTVVDGMKEQVDHEAKPCKCPQFPKRVRTRTKIKAPLRLRKDEL
jgi:hypothetical protein